MWFFNCVLFMSPFCLKKHEEGECQFLGNFQNHKTHLQKCESMTYDITCLGNHNHTISNFWSLGYSWNPAFYKCKGPGEVHPLISGMKKIRPKEGALVEMTAGSLVLEPRSPASLDAISSKSNNNLGQWFSELCLYQSSLLKTPHRPHSPEQTPKGISRNGVRPRNLYV